MKTFRFQTQFKPRTPMAMTQGGSKQLQGEKLGARFFFPWLINLRSHLCSLVRKTGASGTWQPIPLIEGLATHCLNSGVGIKNDTNQGALAIPRPCLRGCTSTALIKGVWVVKVPKSQSQIAAIFCRKSPRRQPNRSGDAFFFFKNKTQE